MGLNKFLMDWLNLYRKNVVLLVVITCISICSQTVASEELEDKLVFDIHPNILTGSANTSSGQVVIPVDLDRHIQSGSGSRGGYVSPSNPDRGCNQVLECRKNADRPRCSENSTSASCSFEKLKIMLLCLDNHQCRYLKRRFCENELIVSVEIWKVGCDVWGLDTAVINYKDKHNIPYEVEQEDQDWLPPQPTKHVRLPLHPVEAGPTPIQI